MGYKEVKLRNRVEWCSPEAKGQDRKKGVDGKRRRIPVLWK